jgi:hypothetical protein
MRPRFEKIMDGVSRMLLVKLNRVSEVRLEDSRMENERRAVFRRSRRRDSVAERWPHIRAARKLLSEHATSLDLSVGLDTCD